MRAPICEFVQNYCRSGAMRLHMPGHKGQAFLGMEALDITEIPGADSLYEAEGIIRESERNASSLFGSGDTLYSAEGSSLCIRAMLYLVRLYAAQNGRVCRVLAGRNAHKTFISACSLLDIQPDWLEAGEGGYLSGEISPGLVDAALQTGGYTALYLTSPDYLGGMADITAISRICREHGVLLVVDNAHGAYLHFLPVACHPLDLGADLCCDSGHKTLPVLTGGAYLHIGKAAPAFLGEHARQALSLFGSTSPSYLILQSLDRCNAYLSGTFPEELSQLIRQLDALKARLTARGWILWGTEPTKLTLLPKSRGYTGTALSRLLENQGLFCEFADPDHLVCMFTPQTRPEELRALEVALEAIPALPPILEGPPPMTAPEKAMSVRRAMLSGRETLPTENCLGRVLCLANVGCPPAVPIVVAGEKIGPEELALLRYYGIRECTVVME